MEPRGREPPLRRRPAGPSPRYQHVDQDSAEGGFQTMPKEAECGTGRAHRPLSTNREPSEKQFSRETISNSELADHKRLGEPHDLPREWAGGLSTAVPCLQIRATN